MVPPVVRGAANLMLGKVAVTHSELRASAEDSSNGPAYAWLVQSTDPPTNPSKTEPTEKSWSIAVPQVWRAMGSALPSAGQPLVIALPWAEASYIEYVVPSGLTTGRTKISRLSSSVLVS